MAADAPVALTLYVGLLDEVVKGAPTLEALAAKGFTTIKAQPGATIPLMCQRGCPTHQGHRRGHFGQLNVGLAHGGGRLKPNNILNSETNAAVLDHLVNSTPFQRLSGFATGVFKSWASRLYENCSSHFEASLQVKPPFVVSFPTA
ncbi:hypothetical protein BDP27DRAFT_1422739 [Rhodocollybia butyracea]|uniref:Uncharacterized protein n=1 Tax=Rhodocollybia butyracea TaxID=206335 RepID=A0A9P5U6A5_9AGAR|nr:hypothetical protein BDP27DRAFT_1422739 [Rhodocollybia butyracea]